MNQQFTANALEASLRKSKGVSFIRLGDGELRFLLECHHGMWEDWKYDQLERRRSQTEARGTLGLLHRDFDRLKNAFRTATQVDVYGFLPFNEQKIEELDSTLPGMSTCSSTPSHLILNEWTHSHLHDYVRDHRVLICSGEGPLLEQLLLDPKYQEISKGYWPANHGSQLYWSHPANSGRDPSGNLEATKKDLSNSIEQHNIDCVLISLGGPAKILAVELAQELNVNTIDFGSMTRALTYSGSDGQAYWRSTHNPFFFRIPLDIWWKAHRSAYPKADAYDRFAKAYCQLTLDLQKKKVGHWIDADVHDSSSLDLGTGNVQAFQSNLDYLKYLETEFTSDKRLKSLRHDFEDWCFANHIPGGVTTHARIRHFSRRLGRKVTQVKRLLKNKICDK